MFRDQRVFAKSHSIYSGALHRHLSPNESPVSLHCQTSEEDHRWNLDVCSLLLLPLAWTDNHSARPLSWICRSCRDVHLQAISKGISGQYIILLYVLDRIILFFGMAMHRGDFTKIDIVLNSILSTKKLRKVRAPSLFS